ncbi:MAG: VTT domain-containing protein [Parvularculaceae bacterium]
MVEPALITDMHEAIAPHMPGVYAGLFLAPFVQEDAAVIASASLSLAAMGDGPLLFTVTTLGLIASDLWKYWLGRAARTQGWAHKFAEKPSVAKAEALVVKRLGATLMTSRFLPGTRIPLYIASGYFKAPWPRFAFWVSMSAIAYVALIFTLFHAIGAVAGEQAKLWLPAVAVGLLALVLLTVYVRQRGPARAG